MKRLILVALLMSASAVFAQSVPDHHEDGYLPPPCEGIFNDIPCPSTYAAWVEQLYNEHITVGCQTNPLLYCPDSSIPRNQMAVFVLKGEHRVLQRFGVGDVKCSNPNAPSGPGTSTCTQTVNNDAIHADSVIQCTYVGTDDVCLPCVITSVSEGTFDIRIQNNREVKWLSFVASGE